MPAAVASVPLYHRYELTFPAPQSAGNHFDTREISLVGDITRPNGSRLSIGGFAHQPHELVSASDDPNALDLAVPTGPWEFRMRYAPTMAGPHHLRAHFRWPDGRLLPAGESRFTALTASEAGYIRISP
ncbi:MAG: hypothetical protein WCI73_19220, partial [Phycisphaerae bacterium]